MSQPQIKFLLSAPNKEFWPKTTLPEVVVLGRSNVGKSTFINALTKMNIAKTSSTPGRTKLLNFFEFEKYILVDAPGYGYSKTSNHDRDLFMNMMDEYLFEREQLRLIILLVDSRIPLTDDDYLILNMIMELQLPFLLLATKSDQLNQSQKAKHLNEIKSIIKDNQDITYYLINKNDKVVLKEIEKIIYNIVVKKNSTR